ncbi:hypothetical protein PHYSODRAFT_487938, partial [Phytophthora sojae]
MSPAPTIVVTNLQEGEVLSYPLVLLEGHITGLPSTTPASTEGLFLEARLDHLRSSLWPISTPSGHFKAFVLLPSPGQYAVTLRLAGVADRVFCVEYRPRVTRYVVKFHYQICSDSDARDGFDAPPGVDNSNAAATAKVRFNALVLQMATAELMHAAGLGRQTFAMQFAADGLPDVTLLRCSFTNAHARSVDGQKLIHLIGKDIEASGVDDNVEFDFKHAVVLGCSRYNTKTRKAEGHTALGGGKVGVFGSSDPHSPHMGFHQASPQGWLELNHAAIREVSSRDGAHWNAGSAQLLRHCPWISGYAKPSLIGPTVSWDDSVRGPVGNGQYNGTQVPLPERNQSMSEADEIGAVMVDAGKYVNRLESFTRAQVLEMEKLRAAGDKHWFVLAVGEHITRMDVRAMAWIDGLQLHTNLRSSRWFGGTGGTLHALQAADGWRVSEFFGTRGGSYVGKLGVRSGNAMEGGPKTPFSTTLPVVGAVVVRCGRFVESIRLLSPEEAAMNSRDPKIYRANEHIFELLPGEKLMKLE